MPRCCCTTRCSRSTRCWPGSTPSTASRSSRSRPSWSQSPRTLSAVGSLRRSTTSSPTCPPGRPVACRPCSKVGVVGAGGRMGQEVCRAVSEAADMELVAAVDPAHVGADACGRTIVGEVNALARPRCRGGRRLHHRRGGAPQRAALRPAWASMPSSGRAGCPTRTSPTVAQHFEGSGANAIVVANFAIGAVLLLHLCRIAAPHMDGVEVIELHHDAKRDAPSGTAMHTAAAIAEARRAAGSGPLPPDPTTDFVLAGARGRRGPRRRPRALRATPRPGGARRGHLRRRRARA